MSFHIPVATVDAETTFGEIDKRLAQSRLKVMSLVWQANDETYSVRVGHHNTRLKRIYYGTGKTLHAALTSALDDYVIDMANTYSRARADAE
jgi:hypothetical protein